MNANINVMPTKSIDFKFFLSKFWRKKPLALKFEWTNVFGNGVTSKKYLKFLAAQQLFWEKYRCS